MSDTCGLFYNPQTSALVFPQVTTVLSRPVILRPLLTERHAFDAYRPRLHPRRDMLQNYRCVAVVHDDAGIIEREPEFNRLARRSYVLYSRWVR